MSEITYHVPEMHCQACENSIRRALEGVDGVQRVEVDLDRKRVRVEYEEGKTGILGIRERIERAGFDVG